MQKTGDFMNKKTSKKIKNYLYQTAGSTWKIPDVQIEISEISKQEIIPGREITRINKFVANEICCSYQELTGDELDFLCDLTTTKYTEAAAKVGLTKSVVSKWVAKGKEKIPLASSLILKKWFWEKVFHAKSLKSVSPNLIFDDKMLFDYLRSHASW